MQFIQIPCQTISEVKMLLPMKAVTFHWGSAVTAIAITQPVTAQVKLISCIPVFTISPPSEYHASSGHNLDDTFLLAGGPTINNSFCPPCPQRSARFLILSKKSKSVLLWKFLTRPLCYLFQISWSKVSTMSFGRNVCQFSARSLSQSSCPSCKVPCQTSRFCLSQISQSKVLFRCILVSFLVFSHLQILRKKSWSVLLKKDFSVFFFQIYWNKVLFRHILVHLLVSQTVVFTFAWSFFEVMNNWRTAGACLNSPTWDWLNFSKGTTITGYIQRVEVGLAPLLSAVDLLSSR